MNTNIYEIVLDYFNKKVSSNLKDEFINASVHFNINNDIYKKYSSEKIECILSSISYEDISDYLEICSVCGYILYRLIENNELNNEDRIEALQIILEISNSISSFIRGRINENQLSEKLIKIIDKLKLTKSQTNKLIEILN